jgi:hypothetical protein
LTLLIGSKPRMPATERSPKLAYAYQPLKNVITVAPVKSIGRSKRSQHASVKLRSLQRNSLVKLDGTALIGAFPDVGLCLRNNYACCGWARRLFWLTIDGSTT